MVEVTFTPSAEDLAAIQRAVVGRQLRSRRFLGRMVAILAFACGAGLAYIFVVDGEVTAASVAALGIGLLYGVVALALIIGGTWLLIPRRARRLFAQQRTAHHETRLTLTPEGLRFASIRADSFYPWDELPGWQLARGGLMILQNDMSAYFLPRRALSEEKLAEAVAILTAAGVPRR
ncbi:YcxB family protein [Sphingomonas sp. 2R-10]|uniref:YcxB family protein n=1 Tax=Sphingomonas sp. 2R-10 TaxID=3045148 RepID=UPI000F769C76|nr:YcxB family protein [Sphingomonas sp. 2R-10]MDJ0278142.1 YcxB family protein [Sphingomonas sp. 2R-10]